MVKIKLADIGFTMIPKGTYTFKVTEVTYDQDFGKLEVSMVTQNGRTHTERYSLITKGGKANEGALKAFSFFAKTALNNMDVDEIDPSDLEGCYIKATVDHVESDTISDKTGKPFINVRLNDMEHAVGFSDAVDAAETVEEEDGSDEVVDDMDDWLNS